MTRREERYLEVGKVTGIASKYRSNKGDQLTIGDTRYFGRAKELPGVKELFEATAPKPKADKPLENRADLRKQVDASYYGYNLDEEDGALLEYESQKEKEAFENLLSSGEKKVPPGWEPLPGDSGNGESWRIPTSEEVQEELVERRRRRLLDKLG